MDSVSSGSSLQFLAKFLRDAPEDDDDDERVPRCSVSTMTPGSIGPVKKEATDTFQVKSENRKTIWDREEVPEGSEFDDTWDPREQPEYQILFKQCVGTEDVFFGMSRKDPSTACCEDMVIKIKLPETKYSDITLDIQDKVLDLRTPKNIQLSLVTSLANKKFAINLVVARVQPEPVLLSQIEDKLLKTCSGFYHQENIINAAPPSSAFKMQHCAKEAAAAPPLPCRQQEW